MDLLGVRDASYKKFSIGGKYERTTENSFKNESTYGRKKNTMLTFYEVRTRTMHEPQSII